jgi:hypothetical protein
LTLFQRRKLDVEELPGERLTISKNDVKATVKMQGIGRGGTKRKAHHLMGPLHFVK